VLKAREATETTGPLLRRRSPGTAVLRSGQYGPTEDTGTQKGSSPEARTVGRPRGCNSRSDQPVETNEPRGHREPRLVVRIWLPLAAPWRSADSRLDAGVVVGALRVSQEPQEIVEIDCQRVDLCTQKM
jgi:hypothetical protein